jgi:hypothetical protein
MITSSGTSVSFDCDRTRVGRCAVAVNVHKMSAAQYQSCIAPYSVRGSPKSGLPAPLLCSEDRELVKTADSLLEMVTINLFTTQVDAVPMSRRCGAIRGSVSPERKAH